jgi:Uma2 family endonuclease
MMSVVMTVPWGRPLTADDFFAMETPDDGQRYELIDGVLVVSPSPFLPHQWVSTQLILLLAAACPAHLRVFHAPLDVRLADDTVVEPDLLVVRAEDAAGKRLTGIPLMVGEILSEYHRGNDLLLKRARYERAGIGLYWIVDPETLQIKVLELGPGGTYAETHHHDLGAAPLTLDKPFGVTLALAR